MEARGGHAGPSRTPPAEEWKADYFRAIPELDQLARRRVKPRDVVIMRASQLDASRLDIELTAMLQEQFLKAFSLVQPRVSNALKPELSLILDFLIFRLSVWRGHSTPGSQLMNLRYRDERPSSSPNGPIGGRTGVEGPSLSTGQRVSWGLAYVLGRYVWARLESIAAACHWVDSPQGSLGFRTWQAMQWTETAYRLASLGNFLVFLRHGKFRSLVERLISARLVYKRASMPRALSFEYLNRQLVWHELSELLLFLLPLVDVSRVKSLVLATLPSIYGSSASTLGGGAGTLAEAEAHSCHLCHRAEPAVPYQALPCQHSFCYYCLRSETEAQPGFKCPACGAVVQAMRRRRPNPS